MPKRPCSLAILTAALLLAPPVLAQSTPEERAAADVLYEEAGKLMKAGQWTDAQTRLEASQKLDPGIGSLIRLAYCYEQLGRTASAWAAYNDTEAVARKTGDKRAAEAAQRAQQLLPKLSRLVLDVAPENRTAGVQLQKDGKPLDPALWGTPLPVDPGAHEIVALRLGKEVWRTTVTVAAKPGTSTVTVPAIPAEAVAPPEPATGGAPTWPGQRIAGMATGGAGVAGLLISAVLGGITFKKVADSKRNGHCDANLATCDAVGLDLQHQARTTANAANVAAALGGAAVVAGVVVFLTTPAGAQAPKSGAWMRLGPVASAPLTGVILQGGW